MGASSESLWLVVELSRNLDMPKPGLSARKRKKFCFILSRNGCRSAVGAHEWIAELSVNCEAYDYNEWELQALHVLECSQGSACTVT